MRRSQTTAVLLAVALSLSGTTARAAITSITTFKNLTYQQTSSAQPSAPTSAFFTSSVGYQNPTDATTATATTSSGPVTYTNEPAASRFFYGPPGFASSAAMDAAFVPGSTFAINISGGTLGSQSTSFSLAADTYSAAVPFLTGGSYASLQGLNVATANTLTFNGFTLPAGANEGYTFALITRVSDGARVFSQDFLSPSTTSLTLAAGTLATGTAYTLEIDYSSRIFTPNALFNGAPLLQAFEQRTTIAFTTASAAAVPEPASLALTAIGVASAGLALRRRTPRTA